jgi:hypothetical protein
MQLNLSKLTGLAVRILCSSASMLRLPPWHLCSHIAHVQLGACRGDQALVGVGAGGGGVTDRAWLHFAAAFICCAV